MWCRRIWCGNYAAANAQIDDLVALAEEKGAVIWKMLGTVIRGAALAVTGKTPEAVQVISDGIIGYRFNGSKRMDDMGQVIVGFGPCIPCTV